MPERTVKKDAKGVFVVLNKRIYRPRQLAKPKTQARVGDNVTLWSGAGGPQAISVRSSWQSHRPWTRGSETWETTDKPRPKKAREGVKEIRRTIRGASLRVVFRDGATGNLARNSTPGADVYLAANAGVSMTYEEWDDLMAEIDEFRDPVARAKKKKAEERAEKAEIQRVLKTAKKWLEEAG